MSSNFNIGLQRLKTIIPDHSLHRWYFDKVLSPAEIPHIDYYKLSTYTEAVKISPEEIIGTNDDSYNGGNWIEMLGALRHFKKYLSGNKLIEFINNEAFAEKKTVSRFGNNYLIHWGGNHRITLSKFMGLKEITVSIQEFVLDKERMRIHEDLEVRGLSPIFVDKHDDTKSCWELMLNEEFVSFRHGQEVKDFLAFYDRSKVTNKTLFKNKYITPIRLNFQSDFHKIKQIMELESRVINHKLKKANYPSVAEATS
jgi:hypothetical protein